MSHSRRRCRGAGATGPNLQRDRLPCVGDLPLAGHRLLHVDGRTVPENVAGGLLELLGDYVPQSHYEDVLGAAAREAYHGLADRY